MMALFGVPVHCVYIEQTGRCRFVDAIGSCIIEMRSCGIDLVGGLVVVGSGSGKAFLIQVRSGGSEIVGRITIGKSHVMCSLCSGFHCG